MNFDEFVVQFPVWLLAKTKGLVKTKSGKATLADKAEFVSLSAINGETSLPIFTDLDSANRFIKSADLRNVTTISPDNMQTLADVLEDVKSTVRRVTFDPIQVEGTQKFDWPIQTVIEGIVKA